MKFKIMNQVAENDWYRKFVLLMFCILYSEECTKKNCQYFLSVDAHVQIDDPALLRDLIEQNR